MIQEKDGDNESKLNLIASLLLDIKESLSEKMSVKAKILYLLKKGVEKDDDLASIIGITKSHASKEKAILRKQFKGENIDG
jgi:hypothetical protein